MASHGSDLSVRRHDRYLCDLPAAIAVSPPSDRRVRLSRAALGADGRLHGRIVDVSRGGLGLSLTTYLPPACYATAEIRLPGRDGSESTVTTSIRIHRTVMSDRAPTYYLGAAFEGADRIAIADRILDALRAAGLPLEKARA